MDNSVEITFHDGLFNEKILAILAQYKTCETKRHGTGRAIVSESDWKKIQSMMTPNESREVRASLTIMPHFFK